MKKARKNSKQAYKELVKVLNYREPSPVFIEPPDLKKPESRFQEGHIYRIASSDKWESECIFRYERQVGIHYVFREIRGGWTRTYTDAQLVGKTIKEDESQRWKS